MSIFARALMASVVLPAVVLAPMVPTARAQEPVKTTTAAQNAPPGTTVRVGRTGFDIRRPVIAGACLHGCPWGELAEFVRQSMQRLHYDVVVCENCNRTDGPRIVARNAYAPPIDKEFLRYGTTQRVDAKVDFGVTESGMLTAAYTGQTPYVADGPYKDLRLIAKIEDPTYVLVAVKAGSGITDLSQIRDKRLPVKIRAKGAFARTILHYYGLDSTMIAGWGGSVSDVETDQDFDVIVNELGSPANNPESSFWSTASQKFDLRFLDLPPALVQALMAMPGVRPVTVQWGLLRGVDRAITTVGRSGEAIFGRADMPEQAAYDLAKGIDANRQALIWYIRPYSYDPNTVWHNLGVPLHPGAERYYREMGYIKLGKPTGQADGRSARMASSGVDPTHDCDTSRCSGQLR